MTDEQKQKLSKVHKGKKFSPEHIENLRLAHLGRIPTNLEQLAKYRKGRPLSAEHKRKIGDAQRGKPKMYSKEALTKMANSMKGKKPWNYGLKGFMAGDKNPRWILDRTKVKVYEKRLGSLYWQWRKKCLDRDKKTCRLTSPDCCGKLEIHHIKRWKDYPELRYEVNNGITLCHFHHPRTVDKERELEAIFISLIS